MVYHISWLIFVVVSQKIESTLLNHCFRTILPFYLFGVATSLFIHPIDSCTFLDAGSLQVRWCSAICSGGGPYATCVFFQVPNECLQSVTSWHSRKIGLNMCPKILATVYGGFLKILAQSLMGSLILLSLGINGILYVHQIFNCLQGI